MAGVRKNRIVKKDNYVSNSFIEIEAISKGVEAQIDPLSTISGVITQRTVEIARRIGINEAEIQKWLKFKEGCTSTKCKLVKLIIDSDESQELEIDGLD